MTGPYAPRTEVARTLPAVLAARAADVGDHLAVIAPGGDRLTYAELHRAGLGCAAGLAAAGVSRGARVVVMADNHIDFVVVWCALAQLGAVGVPVNTAYKGALLSHVLADSAATVAVLDERYVAQVLAADETGALASVIVRGTVPDDLNGRTVFDLADVRATEPREFPLPEEHEITEILYTSGTTGVSKGVLITFRQLYGYSVPDRLDAVHSTDRSWAGLPLFHVGGQWSVYNAFVAGATVVVSSGFRVSSFWSEVREHGCTFALLLGAMASYLMNQPTCTNDADNPLQRVLLVPVIADHAQFQKRFGVIAGTTYGSTESANVLNAPFGRVVPNGCGWPRPGAEVRLVDEWDCEVPQGAVGELVFRTSEPWEVMVGYHNLPAATAAAFRNGWLHTGDLFRRERDGQFVFVDRGKDALRRRGENVSSFEVEREVLRNAEVEECAVVAVPSEHSEDDILLAVTAAPGATIEAERLFLTLADRLPYFMVPRYIDVVTELPKTPSHKIAKNAIRDRGVTAQVWDSERAGYRVNRAGLRRVGA